MKKTILIAGAAGLVGYAALKHFTQHPGQDVIALSRRMPRETFGAYAAAMRPRGDALPYPGGAPRVGQAVDADLLARAIDWAGESLKARNDIFNVTNGDVFVWENIWPAIAESVGMRSSEPWPFALTS
jgi:nucleoside-diphosphate-sugar epimerase